MWQQMQSQQAQRVADQASQTARALQAQARDARSAAERAQQSARDVEIRADQAQEHAVQAHQNVQTAQAYTDGRSQMADVYTQLPQVVSHNTQSVTPSQAAVVTSTQSVGTIVNTTA